MRPRDKLQQHAREQAVREWFEARKLNIHRHVSAADVLARHGVHLKLGGSQQEQLSCPFHGSDNKPSARYFPDSDRSASHVWCFVCNEHWDAIGLWKKFTRGTKYSTVIFEIERAFHLAAPESGIPSTPTRDPAIAEALELLQKCERLLRTERDQIEMDSHLKLGSILDRLRYAFEARRITPAETKDRAMKVFLRIGEKSRAKKVASPEP